MRCRIASWLPFERLANATKAHFAGGAAGISVVIPKALEPAGVTSRLSSCRKGCGSRGRVVGPHAAGSADNDVGFERRKSLVSKIEFRSH